MNCSNFKHKRNGQKLVNLVGLTRDQLVFVRLSSQYFIVNVQCYLCDLTGPTNNLVLLIQVITFSGAIELAAVGVSIAVFNQVSRIAIFPLVSVTTSFVAEEDATSDCIEMQGPDTHIENKKLLQHENISMYYIMLRKLILTTFRYFATIYQTLELKTSCFCTYRDRITRYKVVCCQLREEENSICILCFNHRGHFGIFASCFSNNRSKTRLGFYGDQIRK